MLTRCPSCSTVFRVTPPQLKARAGKVRCGQCREQFNALDSLQDESVLPPAAFEQQPRDNVVIAPHDKKPLEGLPAAPPPDQVPMDTALAEVAADELQGGEEAAPLAADIRTSIAEFMLGKKTDTVPLSEEPPLTAVVPEIAIMAPAEEVTSVIHTAPDPVHVPKIRPEPSYNLTFDAGRESSAVQSSRWPWAIGVLAALLTLAAQAAFQYRVEIAVLQPQLKPTLMQACKLVGCEIPLPRKAEYLGIEASDLHPDPEQKGHLLLVTTLKNRAPFAQEFPLLEVTLNDVSDRPLIIKALKPRDYLPKEVDPARGFGVNAEVAVNLTLDVGDVPAAGYRLYLFYP